MHKGHGHTRNRKLPLVEDLLREQRGREGQEQKEEDDQNEEEKLLSRQE